MQTKTVKMPKWDFSAKNRNAVLKRMVRYRWLYAFLLPMVVYLIVFKYSTIYGILLAFKDFKFNEGIMGSPWVGLKYFKQFVNQPNFWTLIINTFRMTLSSLIFGAPAPIILALFVNEVYNPKAKKLIQTLTYLPHFVSWVVVISLFTTLLSPNGGLVNEALGKIFGMEPKFFMAEEKYFMPLYILIGMWKEVGWGSILYLAAITGVDQELYEAAALDGAGRWRRMLSVTIPCILPTVVIQFLLKVGGLMGVGFDQVYLMQYPQNLEISEAINTYTTKQGLLQGNYSFATSVGLFQSLVGFTLMWISNKVSKTVSETALW